jgi:hypothetical protein
MKTVIIAAAAALAFTAWGPTGASAQPDIRMGPGGVRIDTHRDHWDRRDRWDRRGERCRTIVEREHRYGRTIVTRRRICR